MLIHNLPLVRNPSALEEGNYLIELKEIPGGAILEMRPAQSDEVFSLFTITAAGIQLGKLDRTKFPTTFIGTHDHINVAGAEGILNPMTEEAVDAEVRAMADGLLVLKMPTS